MEVKPSSPKALLVAKASPSGGSPASSPDAPEGIRLSVKKKYVLPPRPKPGRKPSIDTPPSKRKAQNRDAQRAFRERRAAAIQELEVKLSDEARKHAEEQLQMKRMIERLTKENEQLRTSTPPMLSPRNHASPSALSPLSTGFSPITSMSPPAVSPYMIMSPAPSLLDRVLEQKLPVPDKKRTTIPSPKRVKSEPSPVAKLPSPPPSIGMDLTKTDWKAPAVPLRRRRLNSLETDFTLSFKAAPKRKLSVSAHIHSRNSSIDLTMLPPGASPASPSPCFNKRPEDRCGFCTENTPCVCAEAAAMEKANMSDIETLGDNSLPPIMNLPFARSPGMFSGFAPSPPQMPMMAPASAPAPAPVPSPAPAASECTGDPGTCNQCRSDPMSTLFCSTVAAKQSTAAPATGTFIPAQAAYQTLSRHLNFTQADFGKLVDSLQTRGTQVEVNSVARVLRMLDSRLYE